MGLTGRRPLQLTPDRAGAPADTPVLDFPSHADFKKSRLKGLEDFYV